MTGTPDRRSARAAMWVAASGAAWIVGLSVVSPVTGGLTVGALGYGAAFVAAASLVFWRTPWAPVGRVAAVWALAVVLAGLLLWPGTGGAWTLLLGVALLYGTIVTVALLGPVLLLSQLFPDRRAG